MIFSVLLFLSDNIVGLVQDDSDIQTTLDATLETDSSEIYSTLMPTGTYTFWEQPELDVGSFNHDSTRISITDLQYPAYNSTSSYFQTINDGLVGNHTVNSSVMPSYTLSKPFDTSIQINISYIRNYSEMAYTGVSYSSTEGTYGIYTNGTHWFVSDIITKKVKVYYADWTYTGMSYSMPGWGGFGFCWDGNYWYIVRYSEHDVRKYYANWTYTGTAWNVISSTEDIDWDGSYFYILSSDDHIYKYNPDMTYTGVNYNLHSIDAFGEGFHWDGNYFWYVGSYIYKFYANWTYTGITYSISSQDLIPYDIAYNGTYFYMVGNANRKIFKYYDNTFFTDVYVNGFNYTKLGVTYTESFHCNYNSKLSDYNVSSTTGSLIYYFDSSMFSDYDYLHDLIIQEQNLSLFIDVQRKNIEINMSIVISYSSNSWKVPTEVNFRINSQSVTDQTYNSGWISLDTYPISLIITATDIVYFKLNITVDFSFTFSLDIISKTYLKRSFKLLSDHEINLDRMNFDSNLNIKKIYLNNVDKGSSNPTILSPTVSMYTGNIFIIELILSEEIYIPLQYIYNNLGSGTSNIYLSGISNTLTYSNINGNHVYSIVLPTNWHPEYAQLTFSDIDYLPDYSANYSNDLSGYGYTSPSYSDENVNWGARYYQANQNGTKLGENDNFGYEHVWDEYFNALNGYMYHTYGSLDGYNNTYSVNDYLYMQNKFPQELNYEDWISWVHDYNNEYISSNFDNSGVSLTSRLNTNSDSSVPSNSSFIMINGTHTTNGSLSIIDEDYHEFKSTAGGESGIYPANYTFTDDAIDSFPAGWTDGSQTSCYIKVKEELNKHNNILDIFDGSGSYLADMYQSISQSSGVVEFWIYAPSTTNYISIVLYDGSTANSLYFALDTNGEMRYYTGSWHDLVSYSTNAWYHCRFVFDCSTNWTFYRDKDLIATGLGYNGNPILMDNIEIKTSAPNSVSTHYYIDAIDYNWTDGYYTNRNYYPLHSGDVCINMTSQFIFTKTGIQSNDTIDFIRLYYSYKTNESEPVDFYVWNYDFSKWDLINSSTNDANFYNCYFTLNSSHYDVSNTVKLYWWSNASVASSFEFYMDKLVVQVNWTKTSGEIYTTISKDIDFSFLDRYDMGFDNYQKLYNVTIEFLYRYSNYTKYSEFAQFEYNGTAYTLIKDEAWHTIILNFEFNSAGCSSFVVLFNITNGLLELNSNFNYTIFFKCLDTSGYTRIYQYFRYIPPNLNLDWLQTTRGNWILNFTYSFTASSDLGLYTFYNSFNTSLLNILIYVNDESGWEDPVCYWYNTTQSNIDFSFNITNFLNGLGMTQFNDFYIEIYLAGNPSELILDNLTLFDFDDDFYQVQALWITDTLIISHQEFTVYWKASDRYIDRVEIDQLYDSAITTIYNITLLNNTLQSQTWFNSSYGFYELNFTFYDNYSNWELWTLNFTVISSISISTAYKNPIFINEINTISSYLFTDYSILRVWYGNSTDYVLQYDNSSYPLYEYEFNFSYFSSIKTTYAISVKVLSEYNDTFWCNVTLLSVIERTTLLDINNLHYSYYQDEQMNITFILRDLYNNYVSNRALNFTIENPNGVVIVNSSGITNINGNYNYTLTFNTSYVIGFYHLNVSFTGDSNYTGVWKLQSFQVRPILRSANSTDINLEVNNNPVVNNFIQVNWTNNITLTNYNTTTFDMSITLKLNYTESISYSQSFSYSYTLFATSDILSLQFDCANLTNYPSNFTDYYYNNLKSSSYTIIGNVFSINQLLSETCYNDNSFSIKFTYADTTQIERIQLTKTPQTDYPYVTFKEYLEANRTFSYWYFHNSLNISSVSLYHNRTSTTIPYNSFTIENNNYYFEKSCQADDMFTVTTIYLVDWDFTYNIKFDNGTTCRMEIKYKADINVKNVTMIIDLTSNNLYAENWTHDATQSELTYILEIPHLNFTTSQQTLTITGVSATPYTTINSYSNVDDISFSEDNYDNLDEFYLAYLKYPKFSRSFIVYNIQSEWVLDGIHYDNTVCDILSNGYFECTGWGTGITTSFLRFSTNPIDKIKREQYEDKVIYKISCNLPISDANFEFYIRNEQRITINEKLTQIDTDKDQSIVKEYKFEDKTYFEFKNLDLHSGKNEIIIYYNVHTVTDYMSYFLIIAIAIVGIVIIYKRKEILARLGFDKSQSWFLRILMINKKQMPGSKSKKIKIPQQERGKKKVVTIRRKVQDRIKRMVYGE